MSQVEGNSGKELTQKQYNPADLDFAGHVGRVIAREWEEKFLDGALHHGGIDKPSFSEREGMVRESLNEAYDLLSYLHNLDSQIDKAVDKLLKVKEIVSDSDCAHLVLGPINEVINLLE